MKKIYTDVGIENSLQGSTVDDLHTKMWAAVKYFMAQENTPRIIIRNFGTFTPFPSLIAKQLKRLEDKINESEEKEELRYKQISLQRAAEGLEKDSQSRKHHRRGDNLGEKGEV